MSEITITIAHFILTITIAVACSLIR